MKATGRRCDIGLTSVAIGGSTECSPSPASFSTATSTTPVSASTARSAKARHDEKHDAPTDATSPTGSSDACGKTKPDAANPSTSQLDKGASRNTRSNRPRPPRRCACPLRSATTEALARCTCTPPGSMRPALAGTRCRLQRSRTRSRSGGRWPRRRRRSGRSLAGCVDGVAARVVDGGGVGRSHEGHGTHGRRRGPEHRVLICVLLACSRAARVLMCSCAHVLICSYGRGASSSGSAAAVSRQS